MFPSYLVGVYQSELIRGVALLHCVAEDVRRAHDDGQGWTTRRLSGTGYATFCLRFAIDCAAGMSCRAQTDMAESRGRENNSSTLYVLTSSVPTSHSRRWTCPK